jgi:hypothetical protein
MIELIRIVGNETNTSNLFQSLDLVTFSALNRRNKKLWLNFAQRFSIWQIMKLVETLEDATGSSLTERRLNEPSR